MYPLFFLNDLLELLEQLADITPRLFSYESTNISAWLKPMKFTGDFFITFEKAVIKEQYTEHNTSV